MPYTTLSPAIALRELQEINYPILWGGHLARHLDWAGETPTPQELIEYFFIWKSLTWIDAQVRSEAIANN
ncbi:MAG: hypothetical protein V7L27_05695 [Nostoc sp.]|uniref:hypothetical protein n=1 Tax=Nostoc sp. TaxID=1180 RepID=UPI002FF86E40